MKSILDYIAKETDGKNYKSYKYCFEDIEVPKLLYDDKKDIKVRRKGETDKSLKTSKSIFDLSKKISKTGTPLFKYFLDGSRRTYKVDDIAYDKKLYPIIAGQIGVSVCERENPYSFKPYLLKNPLVISLPSRANAITSSDDLFFNNLTEKLNKQQFIIKHGIIFNKILPYDDSPLKVNEKYEDKGVAKIQDEMIDLEKKVVLELVKDRKLNPESYLIKDGSLEYQKMSNGNLRDLSVIKTNYSCVVGVSKAFNPEALSNDVKNISRSIADLNLYHRTPAFMYDTPRIPDIKAQIDTNKAFRYKYVFDDDKANLDLMFSNIEDSSGTMESIINFIITEQGGFGEVGSWTQFINKVSEFTSAGKKGGDKDISVMSWRKFKRIISKSLSHTIFSKRIVPEKNEIRLRESIKNIKKNDVHVIDIAKLDQDTQAFVFGDVIRSIYDLKLGQEDRDDIDIPSKILVFIDELNKYASKDIPKNSPILRQIIDISERGRSLGIILFSVEQFKSAIHDRVKGNCATHAYGRTNAIEISKSDYKFIPPVYKNMMNRLDPGEYIMEHKKVA